MEEFIEIEQNPLCEEIPCPICGRVIQIKDAWLKYDEVKNETTAVCSGCVGGEM